MCCRTAELARIADRKGAIAVGRDADIVIFDTDASFVVQPANIHHRHKLSYATALRARTRSVTQMGACRPYNGESLQGVVRKTFLRGSLVYADGEFVGAPRGQILLRTGSKAAASAAAK